MNRSAEQPTNDVGNISGQPMGNFWASSASSLNDDSTHTTKEPILSLPKGGGALRGIGEKFQANPATGTASLSVPIAVTAGRSGFHPQLSVSYDSGSGNGPFGLGWSLSLPTITRRTDRGLPRYNDKDDTFVLSDTEDLVPVTSSNATQENPDIIRDGYRVRRYCPRIEGFFGRIEKWTSMTDSADTHWRSITPANVTTIYGRDSNSRVFDPDDPSRVFQWLVCESYDIRGNVILHEYKQEDSNGLNLTQAHERHRTDKSRSATKYLKRIRYGNRTPGQRLPTSTDSWMFEVVFDYGEHDDNDPKPNDSRTWPSRRDAFSSYRATFEMRTYRLCRRVLTFHRIPEELGEPVTLVRSTVFQYDENPNVTFLKAVTQSGHVRPSATNPSQGSAYITRSIPPTEFHYTTAPTAAELEKFEPRRVEARYLENLPIGVDENLYRWVDLNGDGLPSVLVDNNGDWLYKQNISTRNFRSNLPAPNETLAPAPAAAFAPLQTLHDKPSNLGLNSGMAVFVDVEGDGVVDLVQTFKEPGFYSRVCGKMNVYANDQENGWGEFQTFDQWPTINQSDPSFRLVDVTGDGKFDLVQIIDGSIIVYPSLGKGGYGPPTVISSDDNDGPRADFTNSKESFHMADLTGDGLLDLVHVRSGSVCYWPNLGYGRYGNRVVMDNAPYLDSDEMFDPRRIRFSDIDGSGTSDLIYLTYRGVKIYRNHSGNSWEAEQELNIFSHIVTQTALDVVDLLGMGTACLVWSSALPSDVASPMQYLDLMNGRKPYLLSKVVNNLGAETHIKYAPSTYFSLKDTEEGKPWITRLPFPVHCVERTTLIDRIARTRFTSRFAYHHGCYDGFEREFRGFASVEQWDAEEYLTLPDDLGTDEADEFSNLDQSSLAPPIRTRMWFHTGIYIDEAEIRRRTTSEFYGAPALDDAGLIPFMESLLPASVLSPTSELLSADEMREAYRSLKGLSIRREVYADDATPEDDGAIIARFKIPYSISSSNYSIQLVQRKETNRHAVFLPVPSESLVTRLDRNPSDPQHSHELVLEVDKYGKMHRGCSVSYGRVEGQSPLAEKDATKQQEIHIVYSETDYTKKVDSANDLVLPSTCEERLYEITGFKPAGPRFTVAEFTKNNFAPLRSLAEIAYQDTPTPGLPQKRLISSSRTVFRSDDMSALLPLGEIQARQLPGVRYRLVLTTGMVDAVFKRTKLDGTVVDLLPNAADVLQSHECGYVDLDGDGKWWIPSGRMYFHPDPNASPADELALAEAEFFLARRVSDMFGNSGTIRYDEQKLLSVESVDPLQNHTSCENDYRVMRPKLLTDPNGNRAGVVYDALGIVVATAVMGKVGERLGDSVSSIRPDLAQDDIDGFLLNPRGAIAKNLLGTATSRFVYDIARYFREPDVAKKKPCALGSITRENHVSDGIPDSELKVQVLISYSDGYERQIQSKSQVEPGPLQDDGPAVDPRWVCSGWTVYNSKGLPVRQYEAFFDDTHEFRFDKKVGVSPIILYDAVERPVVIINPDHSWSKVVFTPWEERCYDSNDTVLMDPKTDPDVGEYFRRLPDSDYLLTWYQARASGDKGVEQQEAAARAAAHADTPTVTHVDSLGRALLHVSDNGPGGKYESRTILDIQGNQRQAIDAKQRIIGKYIYDMQEQCLVQSSMEAGERWSLVNAAGARVYEWNSRGYRFHYTYDALHRPLDSRLLEEGASVEVVVQRAVYGDTLVAPDPRLKNQRGRVVKVYDQAGVVSSGAFDFKGNMVDMKREFASDYKAVLDWSTSHHAMEPRSYTSSQTVDALNRLVTMTGPDGTTTRMTYDASAALATVSANLKGETDGSGAPVWTRFVLGIEYDAKGQRKQITYGNGTNSVFRYDNETFRLINLQTTQGGSADRFQGLSYVFDAAGNIVKIRDDAQQTIFFRGQRVDPSRTYKYDALYRLIEATGREHLGQTNNTPNAPTPPKPLDRIHTRQDHPGNSISMGTYVETYEYDSVGNIQSMMHVGSQPVNPGWTREYSYEAPSQLEPFHSSTYNNRLTSTSIGGVTEEYHYSGDGELHGLMTMMPHLTGMQWNALDQLRSTSRQRVRGAEAIPETTFYVYDGAGQRVRKVTERGGNGVRLKETLYVGNYETRLKYGGDGIRVSLERETVHIMDGGKRVALAETRAQGTDRSPARVIRYQYGNHMDSACLELDQLGRIVSYEEYFAYGGTSYQATSSLTQVPKRYRYTGAERDKENGLDYRGSRYYAAWLGRWISTDPGGLVDGANLYWYAHCNPIALADPSGFQAEDQQVNILARGNYGENMAQKDVRLAYGSLETPVYYKGDATWSDLERSWIVDEKQLISSAEAAAMPDYWGDSNTAANSTTPEPPPAADPGPGASGEKGGESNAETPSLAESFVHGLVKGAATGLVVGVAFGALVASGGTAALLLGAVGAGMMAVQAGEIVVGKDLRGNTLSDNERVEMVGELIGGAIGGGVGSKMGRGLRAATNAANAAAAAEASAAPAAPAAEPAPPAAAAQAPKAPSQPAYRNVTGKRVADEPAVQRVWNSVHDPNATGTPRTLYRNHWRRFWRAVRRPENADAYKYFTDNGFQFPAGKATAPFHPRVGNNRFGRLSLDHMTQLQSNGSPTDPNNLMWMIQGDNTHIQNLGVLDPIDWGAASTLWGTAAELSTIPWP